MPTELLNISEISRLVADLPPVAGHGPLLAALNSRYPKTPFRLQQENDGRTWDVGVADQAGKRVTDKLGKWVDQELATAGGDARAVWEKHKNSGLVRTERVGSCLYLTASFGPDPDAFFQLTILHGSELTTQRLFDPKESYPPEDRQDLLTGPCMMFGDNERMELSPSRYQVEKLTNIRRFLRELVECDRAWRLSQLPEQEGKTVRIQEITPGPGGGSISYEVPFADMCPNWSDRLPTGYRLFQDWRESSAGQGGYRFCEHWWVETGEWKESNGLRRLSLIPQWAESDGGLALPVISPDWEASPYGVMEQLQQFDALVGYPFGWYFYMLHGNRVMPSAGGVIANAVKDGLIRLPVCDEAVLERWRQNQYGF